MRKLIFLFAPASLALLTVMACQTDSAPGGAGPGFDSGISNPNDPPTTVDGGATPDTGPDAPDVPSVSVTVTTTAGPKSGVRVVFHDASGAVIETKLTGADGKATHTGATPSIASALVMNGAEHRIVTWTGVEDGDDLQLRAEEPDEEVGTYDVALSSLPDGGASIIDVESPCERTSVYGTGAALPLYPRCTRAQNAVLATARMFSGRIVGHAFKKGNAGISGGGTGAITVGDWKDPGSFMMSVANVPAEDRFDAQLFEIADGAGFDNRFGDWEGSNVTYPIATGFADAFQASVTFGESGIERAITKRVAPAASATFDHADLLPAIEGAELVHDNPRRPVVDWTLASSTVAIDGGLVRFEFAGPEEGTYSWTLVVPPGATTVTAPAMPAEAESFLPVVTDSFFSAPTVLLLEADVLPSYADFRRREGVMLAPETMNVGQSGLPALPLNGTFRTTRWNEPPR